MQNASSQATGEAMPAASIPTIEIPTEDPRFLRWEGLYPNEAVRLRAMTPAELLATAQAFKAACEGFQSVYNMPRCVGAASDHIENELDRAGAIREMAMQELQRRPLDGTPTDEDRIRAIVVYELDDCGAGIITTLGKITALQAEREALAGSVSR